MKTSTDSRSRVHLYALIAASLALMLLAGVGIYGLPTGPTPPAAHSSAATPPSTAPTAHANPSPTVAKPSAVKGSRNPDVFTWDTTGRVLVIVVTLVLSRGGTDVAFYEYRGIIYPRRGLMCAAKRARYLEVLNQGLNFTQAASAAGVSKHTSKVWRNGRTRSTGRNEHASVDWYRKPRPISSRYLSQVERITMADCLRAGQSIRPIARRLGRSPSSISREIRRNTNPANGSYERRVLVIVAIPVLRCRRAAHQSSSRSMRLSSMRSHGTGTHRGEATCRARAP